MQLVEVKNTNGFKKAFAKCFSSLREHNPSFNKFIYEVSLSNNLFIVGGFLRCVANDEQPRDLDIIVNLSRNDLKLVVGQCFKNFSMNRMGGYKIQLEEIIVDLWSIEDNWAFKKRVVNNIESNHLEKIAKGTFFNYDSLVYDLHTQQYNFKYYNLCSKTKRLDILKKNAAYMRLNPTKEANILRAFYLRDTYGLQFSNQLTSYIREYLDYAKLTFGDSIIKLCETLERYKKYQAVLTSKRIEELSVVIQNTASSDNHKTQGNLFKK